ncbi:hypothetical protein PSI23_21510, partial [Xenorhabdus sp. XENO-10]
HTSNRWIECDFKLYFHPNVEYRIKPRTIRIGDMDIPEAVKNPDKLNNELRYYVPSITSGNQDYYAYFWKNDAIDNERLNSGIIHLDKESALLHAKALIALTQK